MNIALVEGQPVNITSPLYPQNYPSGVTCNWRVRADEGLNIQVILRDFFTAVGFDHLFIGNPSVNYELFNGNNVPDNFTYPLNELDLHFRGDRSERGFSLEVSAINTTGTYRSLT